MTSSLFGSKEPADRSQQITPVDANLAALSLQRESLVYLEVGEFFFQNPTDTGVQVLVAWFNDVASSSPERRWGALEMLALYGLSAVEATEGLPLTAQQEAELVASVSPDGPLQKEFEHAARDVISFLQSGSDPTSELPAEWGIYRDVLPTVFATACLVFAVLTLEMVREVADQEQKDPARLWRDWLTSQSADQ